MSEIYNILNAEIKNADSVFIFHSDIAALEWMRRACEIEGVRSVAQERFLAWDDFIKRNILFGSNTLADTGTKMVKEPVSNAIRLLFAESLIRENSKKAAGAAQEGRGEDELPFRFLVPIHLYKEKSRDFADYAQIFASSIAAVLPALQYWENKTRNNIKDDEDRDYALLKKIYKKFLDDNNLFEPAWETLSFSGSTNKYFLFYPELIENYAEYAALLENESSFHVITLGTDTESYNLYLFAASRRELRNVLLEIRSLHKNGTPYEDMAISVCEHDIFDPYIERDCGIYNIPIQKHYGKILARNGAGRLFALLSECERTHYSFDAIKSLLLNDTLPWQDSEKNKALIHYGIVNNCVCSFSRNGKMVDIWLDAFKISHDEELYLFYTNLKKDMHDIVTAKSFRELNDKYFIFRRRNFTPDNAEGGSETDAVLGRCITILNDLAVIEEKYPEIKTPSPFQFFLSHLRGSMYVAKNEESGLHIFPFRVAAGSPFPYHFLVNVNQKSASVTYRSLDFLSKKKRSELGVDKNDFSASAYFFRAYSAAWVSASKQTFSGWTIPHGFFTPQEFTETLCDPFIGERDFWGEDKEAGDTLLPIQQKGFDAWQKNLHESEFNITRQAYPAGEETSAVIFDCLKARHYQEGSFRVAPTEMNIFFECPLQWFFSQLLSIEEFDGEAKLLDDRSKGNLYHRTLELFFERIKKQQKIFDYRGENINIYRQWIGECMEEAASENPLFRTAMAKPYGEIVKESAVKTLINLLGTAEANFGGFEVAALEYAPDSPEIRSGAILTGRMDAVLRSPENGSVVIVDYKTNKTPSKNTSTYNAEKDLLQDFQMAMYVRMLEKDLNAEVRGGVFVSIVKNRLSAVLGKEWGYGRYKGLDRDEFQLTLEKLEPYITMYKKSVDSLDFSSEQTPLYTCTGCKYKEICRKAYSLNNDRG
jgi:RecB family exonuclease